MPLKSLQSNRVKGILAIAILAAAGLWWAMTEPSGSRHAIKLPERICDHRISRDTAAPLLPSKGSKYEEETFGFRELSPFGTCEAKVDDQQIYVGYTDVSGSKRTDAKGIPVSLGSAYGTLTDEGSINLYVDCANKSKTSVHRLLIGADATVIGDQIDAGKDLSMSTKGLRSLAEFTAQAVRDLTQKWFKCPGADKLPDGPVTIHWDKPAVR